MFIENRVVGFTNETREDENDNLLFEVTFDDELEQSLMNLTQVNNKGPEVEVKVENATDEKFHRVANLKIMLTRLLQEFLTQKFMFRL